MQILEYSPLSKLLISQCSTPAVFKSNTFFHMLSKRSYQTDILKVKQQLKKAQII